MSYVIGYSQCPSCKSNGADRSGDNLISWADGGHYCFACGYTVKSKNYTPQKVEEYEKMIEKTSEKIISKEENKELKSKTGFCDYRGVRSEIWKKLGVRFTFDQETGEPTAQYYPTTINNALAGYSVRHLPKRFGGGLGETGKVCDMFGAFLKKSYHKNVIIVGGQVDVATVTQVMMDYASSKGFEHTKWLVVSSTTGENSYKQIAINYKFFEDFDEIFVGLDNDEAGKSATERLVKELPRKPIRIIMWTRKDPNECLKEGETRAIISSIYEAKLNKSANIKGSGSLIVELDKEAVLEKLPLPPFMRKIQDLMAGGIPLGTIINIASLSGSGKTTVINELIYYWLFNSPYKPGILSMELNCGQYAEVLLSRHLGRKLALVADPKEKLQLLHSDEVLKGKEELFFNGGEDRFYIMDERDGDLKELMKLVEEMIISCGCRVIVLDPLQDLLDGLGNDEQAKFVKWQKNIINKYDIIFINICHMRKHKAGDNKKKEMHEQTGLSLLYSYNEEDIQGTSTIYKSGAANIIFARAKRHHDMLEKNTSYVMLDKCRWTGHLGLAGEWVYDNATHTMYDKEKYLKGER